MPIFIAIILLAVTNSIMYAINYLIVSLIPMRFVHYGHTSIVTGMLNSFAYLGSALSSYCFGFVSQKIGWTAVIAIWIVCSVLTGIFAFIETKKWNKFIH